MPYFGRQWPELIRLVILWDGRSSGLDTYHDFYADEGRIRHPYANDGYREGIKNLAQWYAEGLVDAEVFTRGSSAREYLLSENLGDATHGWFASISGYNRLSDKIEGFEFKVFAPPASAPAKRIEEHRRIPIKPDGRAIGYTNDHPVETIKCFDFWFSGKGRRPANFGVEGMQYTMVDGEPIFTEGFLNNDQPETAQLWGIGAQLQARGYFRGYEYGRQWSNKFALEGVALYDQGDYLIDQFPGVAFSTDEQRVYDRYWSSIRDYMLERQQARIFGNGDVETEWDAYMAALENLGFSDVLRVMQSAYERRYGG